MARLCALVGTEAEANKEWVIEDTCTVTECCHQGQCIRLEKGISIDAPNCSPLSEGEICSEDDQCQEELNCHDGMCCAPDCWGKECGIDGCGGLCGYCEGPQSVCMDGQCECVPDCDEKNCGDDGCGGSCGGCGASSECQDGQCSVIWWEDTSSGLTWENAPTEGRMLQSEADTYCAQLSLGGYQDWRVPTIGELRSLVRGCPDTAAGGKCNIEEGECLAEECKPYYDCTPGCAGGEGPGEGGCYWPEGMKGKCSFYGSSTAVVDETNKVWRLSFYDGDIYQSGAESTNNVRCVR